MGLRCSDLFSYMSYENLLDCMVSDPPASDEPRYCGLDGPLPNAGISDKGQTPKFAPHVRYSDFPCCSCLHSTPFKRSAQPRICIVRMVKYPHESLTEKRRPALEKLTWRKKLFTERRIRRRTKCRVINDGRSPARLSRGILSDRWPRMSWRQSRLSSLSPTPCHKTSVPPSLRERLNTLNPEPSVKISGTQELRIGSFPFLLS